MCRTVLTRAGATEEAADLVANSFVDADLMGIDSHGVAMLRRYLEFIEIGWVDPQGSPEVEKESASTLLVNGNWAFGAVACHKAMALAAAKATQTGVASVSVHSAGHCGRLGQYPQRVSQEGLIGIAMVNNHGAGNMVAPYGGTERRLSTNPLAVAIPYKEGRPILLDMTTSVVAERRIKLKNEQKEKIPAGWFITADGETPTDPGLFYAEPKGALLPMGGDAGYKGYGLALIVDILAGALSGAGCSNPTATRVGNAFFGIVIDPAQTAGGYEMLVQQLIEYVKSADTTRKPGRIYYPGEIEQLEYQDRQRHGVPISDGAVQLVKAAMRSVELDETLLVESEVTGEQ